MRKFLILILFFVILPSGCAVNPVTGERQLSLVGEQQEITLGKEQYNPSIQMQGGRYAIDPEINEYVQEIGQRLARVSDRQLPYEFSLVNNSVPNAWALPGGKIAVNRGLLIELNNEAELAAVISHEIVHAAARHGAQQLERGLLLQTGIMATGIAVSGSEYARLAVGGAQVAAQLISQKYSREMETEADYYGMTYMSEAGYDPNAAVSLQEKFVKLAGGKETNWLEGLFASHPPSQQRVEQNIDTAENLPDGGVIADERYMQITKPIRQNAPAYEAYNEGIAALEKGNLDRAWELTEKAISIEPKEGKFYGLQGDIHSIREDYDQALQAYDKAVKQPGQFFYLYLQRGITEKKLGQIENARMDLQKSLDLLPTALAYNELGELSLAENQKQKARQYFRQAASSQSQVGKDAFASLVRLDLPDNPSDYLQLRAEVTDRNVVRVINIKNVTPLPIGSITITAVYTADGVRRQENINYPPAIAPGSIGRLQVSLPANNLRLRITSARVTE